MMSWWQRWFGAVERQDRDLSTFERICVFVL